MEGISYPHAVEIAVNKGILPNGNELALNRWADYYSWCISLSWDGGVMMEGGDDYKCLAASFAFFPAFAHRHEVSCAFACLQKESLRV
jgi:hypothetical protein